MRSIDVYYIPHPSGTFVSPLAPNCGSSPLSSNGVCDASLSLDARAAALVAAMAMDDKIGFLSGDYGIPSLGIPSYEWWNEGLHGVAISLASTFKLQGRRSARQRLFRVLST